MARDLLNNPIVWHQRPTDLTPLPSPNRGAPGGQPAAATLVLVAVLVGLVIGFLCWQAVNQPPPAPRPEVPTITVNGPHGAVNLPDYPDGRQWRSWYQANQDWAGPPLWADRPYGTSPSCAAFVTTIVCWNPDATVQGTSWAIAQRLLGTQAMLHAGLEPDAQSQPAMVVASYIAQLAARGDDVWWRFGAIQSPPITIGDKGIQYYQFTRFEWNIHDGVADPASVRLAPLGQLAVDQGW